MVGEPSRAAPELDFALGGGDFQGDTGRARLRRRRARSTSSRTRSPRRAINLNITRRSHAIGLRLVDLPAVRARRLRRRDRLEPVRGDRALVRAGPRAARRRRRRRGARRLPRAARRPRRGRGDGPRARASGCSTSTPTRTAPSRCSSSVGPRGSRAAVVARPASRSSPRSTRRSSIGARDRRRSAPSTRASTSSSSPTARPTAPPRWRAEHGAHVLRLPFNLGIGGAVQTGFRYALGARLRDRRPRRRRRPARPGRARRASSRRCSRARPTSSSARASSAPTATAPPRARRIGIRVLAWTRLALVAPARHRPDLGLPGAQPPRDRAVRRRLSARLPGGRGDRDGAPQRPAPRRGAGRRCASAAAGARRSTRSIRSTTWSRCCSRSSSTSSAGHAAAAGGRMTPLRVSIAGAIASVLLLLVVLELIRSRRLQGALRAALARDRRRPARPLGLARRPEHDRRLARRHRLPAGGAVRGRDPVRDPRAAALLDGDLAALRPERDARAAARAARAPHRQGRAR